MPVPALLFPFCGPDQAFLVVPDQVFAAGTMQGLAYEVVILWVAVLYQCALQGFLMGRFGHVNGLHCARIDASVVNASRNRGRRGGEILYLLGVESKVAAVLGKLNCLFERGARVRRHQIGHHVLVFAQLFADAVKFCDELVIYLVARFAHDVQHHIGYMFGSHAQLAAHVMLYQLA